MKSAKCGGVCSKWKGKTEQRHRRDRGGPRRGQFEHPTAALRTSLLQQSDRETKRKRKTELGDRRRKKVLFRRGQTSEPNHWFDWRDNALLSLTEHTADFHSEWWICLFLIYMQINLKEHIYSEIYFRPFFFLTFLYIHFRISCKLMLIGFSFLSQLSLSLFFVLVLYCTQSPSHLVYLNEQSLFKFHFYFMVWFGYFY